MSDAPSSNNYLAKAEAALSGARLLVRSGDTEGACGHAYCAMSDAAHSALFALGNEQTTAPIKTHNGLVALFGRHVVLAGHMSAEMGKLSIGCRGFGSSPITAAIPSAREMQNGRSNRPRLSWGRFAA
jgi:uncharacterized protein (UPF0332 family)